MCMKRKGPPNVGKTRRASNNKQTFRLWPNYNTPTGLTLAPPWRFAPPANPGSLALWASPHLALGNPQMSRRHHDAERRGGRPMRLGEVVVGLVDDLRFRHQVEKLHRLGHRAVHEFLIEIAEQRACRTFIAQRLEAYSRLDPELVKALDGETFPHPPLYEVKP